MPLKIFLRDAVCFETFVTEKKSPAVALNAPQNTLLKDSGTALYLLGS